MKKIYDWEQIQKDYDSGFTCRDLEKKYGMSKSSITKARRRGDLITRNKSEAGKLFHSQNEVTLSEEARNKISESIKKKYENGGEVKCGRAPKYTYESKIAGVVKLDGSWELKVAKYLDGLEVNGSRNKERFNYINLKGNRSTYCPDFGVEDGNTYIEVKGYKTDLDLCKGRQFPENLQVGERDKLEELDIL